MLTQVKADPEPRAEQEAAKASWLLPAAFSDFSRLSSHKKSLIKIYRWLDKNKTKTNGKTAGCAETVVPVSFA